MALLQNSLYIEIKKIFDEIYRMANSGQLVDQKKLDDIFAKKLASVIDKYIKSGEVTGTSLSGGPISGKII